MRKIFVYLPLTMLLASLVSAQQTVRISDRKADTLYERVLEPYLSFFAAVLDGSAAKEQRFVSLFDGERVYIDNDFNSARAEMPFRNAADYRAALIHMFIVLGRENYDNLDITLPESINDIKFCYGTGVCYVWMKKTFTYRYKKRENKTVSNWVRLKLKHVNSTYKITEIIKDQEPKDIDRDNVADDNINGQRCDYCPDTDPRKGYNTVQGCTNKDRDGDKVNDDVDLCPDDPGSKKARGCPDIDNDGTTDKSDECAYQKGASKNNGCRIGELIFSVDGGINYPTGSSYSNREFLNNQHYTWQNSSLAQLGYMANMSFQYRFSTWMGIGIGEMFFSNRFNSDRLKLSIEAFLTKNGVSYKSVTATNANYSFHVPHIKLCLGTFWKENSVFTVEPTVGMAFNSWSRKESFLLTNYTNGNSQADRISLKTMKSFVLLGGKVGYEFWDDIAGCGFSVNAFYFSGNAPFSQQQVKFGDLPDVMTFGKNRIQILGGTIGFHCYLTRGSQSYKH